MTDESNLAPTEWYPPEAKEYVANKGWKGPADTLTAYQSLEKLMTADKAGRTVVLPKDDTDAEGIKAFRTKLGVPDAPDAYELPFPEGEDGEFAKTAASWFHEAGVPKAAAQKIAQAWNDFIGKEIEAGQQADAARAKTEIDGLRSEWGDKFDAHSELAKRAISTFAKKAGLDEANIKSLAGTLDSSAALRKLFAAIGHGLGESNFVDGGAGSGAARALQEKVKALKEQRMKGTISQADYLREMEVLGPQMESAA